MYLILFTSSGTQGVIQDCVLGKGKKNTINHAKLLEDVGVCSPLILGPVRLLLVATGPQRDCTHVACDIVTC